MLIAKSGLLEALAPQPWACKALLVAMERGVEHSPASQASVSLSRYSAEESQSRVAKHQRRQTRQTTRQRRRRLLPPAPNGC